MSFVHYDLVELRYRLGEVGVFVKWRDLGHGASALCTIGTKDPWGESRTCLTPFTTIGGTRLGGGFRQEALHQQGTIE